MGAIFIAIGGIGVAQINSHSSGLSRSIGALMIISAFVDDVTVGPVAYSLVSEIPSSLLRSKSVVIARTAYSLIAIVGNIITPYQLNPSAWNWGAKSGFFWAASCLLALLFTYFYIPEPKDRTTAELDILFEKKISARKFSKTEVHISEFIRDRTTA
jgi:MFS transporter, SP family, general alpha glucoside:H+ symporter